MAKQPLQLPHDIDADWGGQCQVTRLPGKRGNRLSIETGE